MSWTVREHGVDEEHYYSDPEQEAFGLASRPAPQRHLNDGYDERDAFDVDGPTGRRSPHAREDRFTRREREVSRFQLDDVADALNRLMDGSPQGNRHERRAMAARSRAAAGRQERGEYVARPAQGRSGGQKRSRDDAGEDARAGRIEAVLRALDRLDQRVETLSEEASQQMDDGDWEGERHAPSERRAAPFHSFGERDFATQGAANEDEYDYGGRHGRSAYGKRSLAGESDYGEPAFLREISREIERASAPGEKALGEMRREISLLRSMLANSGASQNIRSDSSELRRLSAAVGRMEAQRFDPKFERELRHELNALRSALSRSNVEGQLQSLESGYAHLVQRLDEMARGAVDPQIMIDLEQRLHGIDQAFRVLPRADQFEALEERVTTMARRVEELLSFGGGRGMETLRGELHDLRVVVDRLDVSDVLRGIDDHMHQMDARLSDVERYMAGQGELHDRILAMEDRLPDTGAVDRLQARLEEITGMLNDDRCARSRREDENQARVEGRFDDIVGRLERIERSRQMPPSYDAAFSLLEKRLNAIDTKIDGLDRPKSLNVQAEGREVSFDADLLVRLEGSLSKLSSQMESGKSLLPGEALGELRSEIASLKETVRAPLAQAGAGSKALEKQIQDLADALNKSGRGSDDRAFSDLEAKIGRLAKQLEAADNKLGVGRGVEQRLEKLDKRLGELGRAKSGASSEVISGLQADLKRLMNVSDENNLQQRQNIDDVQTILTSVNSRLTSLENGGAAKRSSGSVFARVDKGGVEDNRPLEPGSGAPHAALGKGAMGRGDRGRNPAQAKDAVTGVSVGRDRKADFIAAARRAAQAASAEVSAADENVQATDKSVFGEKLERATTGAGGWLKSRLAGRKTRSALAHSGGVPDVGASNVDAQAKRTKGADKEASRKELRAEIAASMANLRADADEGGEPKGKKAGGGRLFSGRRRAILLAAAAILLAIGAVQVFRMVDNSEIDIAQSNVPSVTLSSIEGEPETTANVSKALPDSSISALQSDAGSSGARVQGVSASVGSGLDVEEKTQALAFAPPSRANTRFNEAKPTPSGQFDRSEKNGTPQPLSSGVNIDDLPDEEIGSMSLRQAAARGDAAAQFEVAARYMDGTGVRPDLKEAVRWYEKAAAKGLAPAQYRLGSLYEKGRGVAKNLETARLWYVRAAEKGNAKAAHNLAVLYAEGANGKPNFEKAARWFKEAAGYDVRDSQYNLGILYARGLGIEKDLLESYKWFALAAKQGDQDAAAKRDEVANMLDKTQLAQARLAVETWKPEPLLFLVNEVVADPEWRVPVTNASQTSFTGDEASMILQAQKLLDRLGYKAGAPDGKAGPQTRQAIQDFQKNAGLEPTGKVTPALIQALSAKAI